MIAHCCNCSSPFRFDEAKIHQRAVVRCPACQERNLLTQDPNSAEPRFFVTRAETEPGPAVPSPIQPPPPPDLPPHLMVPPLQAPAPTPTVAPPSTIRPASAPITLEDNGEVLDLQLPLKSEGKARAPQAFERETPANRRPPDPAPRAGGLRPIDPVPRSAPPAPKASSRPGLSGLGRGWLAKARRALKPALTILALSLVAAALWGFWSLSREEAKPVLDPEKDAVRRRGLAVIDTLKAVYPAGSGESADWIKEGEMAFRRDLPEGYDQARTLFARALPMDPENVELIARYAESSARTRGWPHVLADARTLIDLIDYGLQLSPDFAALHRAKAVVFMALQQNERALIEAELARKLEPSQAENLVVWGEALIFTNPLHASEVLREVLDSGKGPITAIAPLARAYLDLGDYASAEETLKLRDKLDPSSCAACPALARLFEDLGLEKEAKAVYTRLAATRPTESVGLLGLARLSWRSTGKAREALKLLELPPSRLNAFSIADQAAVGAAQSRYALLAGDFTLALITAKRAYEADPRALSTRYHYALAILDSGALEREVMGKLLESLTLDAPKHPDILMLRGLYAYASGDLAASVNATIDAQSADPTYVHAPFMLALLYLEAANVAKTMDSLRPMQKVSPLTWADHPVSDETSAVFRYEEKLLKKLDQLEESDVDQDRKFLAKGILQSRMGAYADARTAFLRVLNNQPDNETASLYLAWIAYVTHNAGSLRTYLSRLWERDRNHPGAAELHALQLIDENRREEARKFLLRVVTNYGREARLKALLSELSLGARDVEAARRYALEALALDPQSQLARRARFRAR